MSSLTGMWESSKESRNVFSSLLEIDRAAYRFDRCGRIIVRKWFYLLNNGKQATFFLPSATSYLMHCFFVNSPQPCPIIIYLYHCLDMLCVVTRELSTGISTCRIWLIASRNRTGSHAWLIPVPIDYTGFLYRGPGRRDHHKMISHGDTLKENSPRPRAFVMRWKAYKSFREILTPVSFISVALAVSVLDSHMIRRKGPLSLRRHSTKAVASGGVFICC